MRQTLVPVIVLLCLGSSPAMSLCEEGPASGATFGNTILQISTVREDVLRTSTVATLEEQQTSHKAQEQPGWIWLWPYIAIGLLGTIMAMAPWLIVAGMAFDIFRKRDRASPPGTESAAGE
jgi:hypothetical protein